MATKMEELCDQVLAARAQRDDLKGQLGACEKALDDAEAKLSATLAEGDGKCTHAGYSFSSSVSVSFKTVKDAKDKLVGLLKEGAPELVQETVNAASLSAFLRKNEKALDADKPNWWAKAKKLVERSESVTLSVRKAAAKKK